jgi:hypothetical protein
MPILIPCTHSVFSNVFLGLGLLLIYALLSVSALFHQLFYSNGLFSFVYIHLFYFVAFRPTLGPTQPPIQWLTGELFPGDKAAGA